jgi:hypothetical protein
MEMIFQKVEKMMSPKGNINIQLKDECGKK